MNKTGLIAVFICIMSFVCYEKFYLKPKKLNPSDDFEVVLNSKDKAHYKNNQHIDGNLDGVITVGEQKKAYELTTDTKFIEMMKFVKSLNSVDRRVVNGLSFEEAKQAVLLPADTKFQLANFKLDQNEKIDRIHTLLKKSQQK